MKLQDVPFVEELKESESMNVMGGIGFYIRGERTSLDLSSCIDEARLAYLSNGLQPSITGDNLSVYSFVGNNVVLTLCDPVSDSVTVISVGDDAVDTHSSRSLNILLSYSD